MAMTNQFLFTLLLVLASLILAGTVGAQSAADPKVIDFTARMDTLAVTTSPYEGIYTNLNCRRQDSDGWEDFDIAYNTGAGYSALRNGGPWLFDTVGRPHLAGEAIQYGDFTGDGVGDIIDNDLKFHRGIAGSPYFDSAGGAWLTMHDSPGRFPIGAVDYDHDGVLDYVAEMYLTGSYLAVYRGRTGFGSDGIYQYPDDSLMIPGIISGSIARFNPKQSSEIVFFAGMSKGRQLGLLHSGSPMNHDSITWLTDTNSAPPFSTQYIYSADITGDGIPDLLVSTGDTVYIFKGGDDFGTYKLTPQNAYYKIPSPQKFDRTGNFLGVFNFGEYMHALGDLSGAGIPYILIEADFDNFGVGRCYCMIYAGGKALDSLYDGIIVYRDALVCPVDTLHSINASGRSAGMIVHNSDASFNLGDIDNLLYRDCDKLPHRTNPNLQAVTAASASPDLSLSLYPAIASRYVKLAIASPRHLEAELGIFDLLGRPMLRRKIELNAGTNQEYFETQGLANGTYSVRLMTNQGLFASTKFIVSK